MEKKQFQPTPLGEKVNAFLEANFNEIINEGFTSTMEERLDAIAGGDVDWRALMGEFYAVFSKDLRKAKEDDTGYKLPVEETGETCPECGGKLIIKHGRNGDFIGCSNFPSCTFTKSIVKTTGVSCPQCGKGELVEKISKRGKVFYSCNQYPSCDYATWDPPTGEKCPICGDLLLHRKNRHEDRVYCHNEKCPNHA